MEEEEKIQEVVIETIRISEFSIFMPRSSNNIFSDYPELKQFPEFKALQNSDMLFVWYVACEASPLHKITSNAQRAKLAVELAYRDVNYKNLDRKKMSNLEAGNWGDKIGDAIQRMKSFRIGPRIRALQILEKGFENLEKIINTDASDQSLFKNTQGEFDFGKYKAFVDCVKNATAMMPDLIRQIESGFSVIRKNEETEEYDTMSYLDGFHEESD